VDDAGDGGENEPPLVSTLENAHVGLSDGKKLGRGKRSSQQNEGESSEGLFHAYERGEGAIEVAVAVVPGGAVAMLDGKDG